MAEPVRFRSEQQINNWSVRWYVDNLNLEPKPVIIFFYFVRAFKADSMAAKSFVSDSGTITSTHFNSLMFLLLLIFW